MKYMFFSVFCSLILIGQALAMDVVIPGEKSEQNHSVPAQTQVHVKTLYGNSAEKDIDHDLPRASTVYYDNELGEYIEIHRTGPDSYFGYNHDKGIYLDFIINPEGGMIIYDSNATSYNIMDVN